MSLAQSAVERLQREISSLQSKVAAESKEQATLSDRINRARTAMNKTTSASTARSKASEIARLEKQLSDSHKRRAAHDKKIADKTKSLYDYQNKLAKEQVANQRKALSQLGKQWETQQQAGLAGMRTQAGRAHRPDVGTEFDCFVCHASEDKDEVAAPLAKSLGQLGLVVWYDDLQLKVGDSLRRSIDKGLARSRFGIVVISPAFFAKNWPQYELDGLVTKEMEQGRKVVLPIWHKVSKDEVSAYSPSLADKFALNTSQDTIGELAEKLAEVIGPRTS